MSRAALSEETDMSKPTLTPFQRATVDRATRNLPRYVAEGMTLASALHNVMGSIGHPLRAERDAARALVFAAYGVTS